MKNTPLDILIRRLTDAGWMVHFSRMPANIFEPGTPLGRSNGKFWCGLDDERGVRMSGDFGRTPLEALRAAMKASEANAGRLAESRAAWLAEWEKKS